MNLHELLDYEYGPDGDVALRRLLAAGADLNARSGDHAETPLHQAAWFGQPGNARLLIEAGSRLTYPDQPEGEAYRVRLLADATPRVRELLETAT